MENVNFYTFDGFYFPVSRPTWLKLHILARLIESFPTVCGLWSCVEIKMSILLGAHAKGRRWKIEILHFRRLLFSVLHRFLLKLHILARLIDSFPALYGLWSCIEIKISIPRGAHA